MTNASGLQHICVSVRQIGMMVQRMVLPLFLPWEFERATIRQFLQAIQQNPVAAVLEDCLMERNFTQLWSDPRMISLLRTRCLLCALQCHPAELRDHICSAHASDTKGYHLLMPSLIHTIGRDNTTDFQCDACLQIYNYPATGQETDSERADRSLLAQIHLQHQCPVLLQLALLLQDHGRHRGVHGRGTRRCWRPSSSWGLYSRWIATSAQKTTEATRKPRRPTPPRQSTTPTPASSRRWDSCS